MLMFVFLFFVNDDINAYGIDNGYSFLCLCLCFLSLLLMICTRFLFSSLVACPYFQARVENWEWKNHGLAFDSCGLVVCGTEASDSCVVLCSLVPYCVVFCSLVSYCVVLCLLP